MARGKSRKSSHNNTKRGSYTQTANTSLLRIRLSPILLPSITPSTPSLTTWNPPQRDLRRVPPKYRVPTNLSGTRARMRPAPSRIGSLYPSSLLTPAVPAKVWTCVRRKIRREVLFAAGVGGSRAKKRNPHHTETSKIRC